MARFSEPGEGGKVTPASRRAGQKIPGGDSHPPGNRAGGDAGDVPLAAQAEVGASSTAARPASRSCWNALALSPMIGMSASRPSRLRILRAVS